MRVNTIFLISIVILIGALLLYYINKEQYNWSTVYQDVCQSQIRPGIMRCQKEHGFGQDYLNCSCKIGENCASVNSEQIQTNCKRELASEFKICDKKCVTCEKYTKDGKCRYVCNPSSPDFSQEKCKECTDCNTTYGDNCKAFDIYTERCNAECEACLSNPCTDPINGPCTYDKFDKSKWTNIKNPEMCETCKQYCAHIPFNCDIQGDGNYFR